MYLRRMLPGMIALLAGFSAPLFGQPPDGTYEGTTAQGETIEVIVEDGALVSWLVDFQCPGVFGHTRTNSFCPIQNDGSFACGSTGCVPFSPRVRLTGSFDGTRVSGLMTFNLMPGISGSCCRLNDVPWSAELQGGGGSPPDADFSWTPDPPAAGEEVEFEDESTGGPTSWDWDFDDGSTSSAQDPSHTFDLPGTYTVELTVSNAFGSDTTTREVTVLDAAVRLSDVADLIVPGFEVEVGEPQGPTTLFAVRNTTGDDVDVRFDYHGEEVERDPLRSDAFTLGPQETLPRNVRDDLTDLAVTDGFATGLVLVREDGKAAGALEGDYFRVDFGNDFATGDRLVRPSDFCERQEIRYVDFGSGSRFQVLVDQPQGEATPSFLYTAYDEAGAEVGEGEVFTSQHLSVLDVGDLVAGERFGTMVFDFSSAGGGWVSARYSAFGRFSVELDSACRDE